MKKFLSVALALAMTLSLAVVGASATEYKDLKDKDQIQHSEAVSVMNKIGVISGYTDGTFKPTASITRGAAAKIVCYAKLGATVAASLSSEAAPFKDVSTSNVFAPYIAYCTNMKIVNGYADKTFRPSTNLTGYAFAKMLLNALGISGTYTGNGWEINVATAAQNVSLFDGIDSTVVMSKALSRDNACQMALNAMNYSATSTVTYGVTVNTNKAGGAVSDTNTASQQYTFTSSSEAMSFYAVMNAQVKTDNATLVKGAVLSVNYDGKIETSADSLLKSVFSVSRNTSSADAFGQPNTTYSNSTWTSDLEFPATAVKTYTTSVTLGTLYKDLGLSAAKGYTMYVDGTKSDVAAADAQAITKGSSTALAGSGNGVLTEVYKDGTAYTIAQVNTYVGDVTAVTSATASKSRYITVTTRGNGTSGTFTTDDLALGDVVLYTYSNMPGSVGIQSVEKAKVVTGTVTAYSTATGVTLDTTTYGYSAKVQNQAGSVKVAANVVLDKYGYAIDVTGATSIANYAIVTAYEKGNTIDGMRANLLFTDGTTKTVSVNDTAVVGSAYTYVVNSNGTYTLSGAINAAAPKVSTSGTKLIANNSYDLGNAVASLVGNGDTIFQVATKTADVTSYKTYVGIKNVPTIILGTAGADAKVTVVASSNLAKIVYVDLTAANAGTVDTTTTSTTNSIFVYYTGKETLVNDSVKGYYYTYKAVVNGTVGTLDVAANADASHTAPVTASGVYTGIAYDTNKVVTTLTPGTVFSGVGSAKASSGTVGLGTSTSAISMGYFTCTSDCKVFMVDGDGTLTAASLAAITDSSTNMVYYTESNGLVNYIYVVPNGSAIATIDSATAKQTTGTSGLTLAPAVDNSAKTVKVTVTGTPADKDVVTVTLVPTAGVTLSATTVTLTYTASGTSLSTATVTATAANGTVATYTVSVA